MYRAAAMDMAVRRVRVGFAQVEEALDAGLAGPSRKHW